MISRCLIRLTVFPNSSELNLIIITEPSVNVSTNIYPHEDQLPAVILDFVKFLIKIKFFA